MIHHIFRIIWNERKSNLWLLMEYILIFCILWFCCDYLYNMTKSYFSPTGYDINNTYIIKMAQKPNQERPGEEERYAAALTFMERVKKHPDIESIAFSHSGLPYTGSKHTSDVFVNSDSLHINVRLHHVTSGFFDVYNIKMEEGKVFDWKDDADHHKVIISPFKDGYFKSNVNKNTYPLSEVHSIRDAGNNLSTQFTVSGITDKKKNAYWDPYESNAFFPLKRQELNLSRCNIVVRVKPGTKSGFPIRFVKDMREQLYIGPYFLYTVTPTEESMKKLADAVGVNSKINSSYAITAFLIVNIFLGILGSFWFRTQSRRNEIGLRMALGASKRNVQTMFISEALLLLSAGSIIAAFICLHFGNSELVLKLGIPRINREEWGIGYEQDIINFILTFVFLAIVSVIAVWYPARQAANTQPAEVLRGE